MSTPPPLLAATDFSDDAGHAAERAALLAAQQGAALQLLHVVSRPALDALRELLHAGTPNGAPNGTEDALHADAHKQLDACAAGLAARSGARVATRVAVGRVLTEILAAAQGAQWLVVGARGQRTLRERILGGTTEALLHRAQTPVLVVRRAPQRAYRRVLVPLDFSAASPRAVQWALRLAPQAEVGFVHAIDLPFEDKLWLAGVAESEVQALQARARAQALQRIAALAAPLEAARRLTPVVEREAAPRLILASAERLDADLIVLARQDEASVAEDLLLGSVARQVLDEARCDVLVLRAPEAGAGGAERERG